MPNATRTARSRPVRVVIGAIIAILLVAGGVAVARDEIAERFVDPAPVDPAVVASAALTEDEQAFYDYVAPRLSIVSAEGNELVRLATGRSRNLIELETRGERVTEGAEDIDAYVAEHGIPDRFADAMGAYRAGIVAVRTGIDEARAGVLSFNWDRVAAAVDRFETGAGGLAQALNSLRDASGVTILEEATPTLGAV